MDDHWRRKWKKEILKFEVSKNQSQKNQSQKYQSQESVIVRHRKGNNTPERVNPCFE